MTNMSLELSAYFNDPNDLNDNNDVNDNINQTNQINEIYEISAKSEQRPLKRPLKPRPLWLTVSFLILKYLIADAWHHALSGIEGLLGLSFLKHFRTLIDYTTGLLELTAGG
jgi:hypothetical protein